MIKFRQKEFSEYDAMRSLYVELMKRSDRSKFGVIDLNSLIPILKGNNVVIEKFVISTSILGRDKYRMYLRIGNKAKMPDEIRLPQRVYDKRLGNMQVNINNAMFERDLQSDWDRRGEKKKKNTNNNNLSIGNGDLNTEPPKNDNAENKEVVKEVSNNKYKSSNKKYKKKQNNYSSIMEERLFDNNNNNKKTPPYLSSSYSPNIDISYEVRELLGEAVRYDKKERSLVLEFSSINDAISALNILPFGLGYKIYLLNS